MEAEFWRKILKYTDNKAFNRNAPPPRLPCQDTEFSIEIQTPSLMFRKSLGGFNAQPIY